MPTWMMRSLVAFEVGFVGVLVYVAARHVGLDTVIKKPDTVVMVAVLLVLVTIGLWMKLRHRWSTRVLWEWMFVGMMLVGGWIYPRLFVSGYKGVLLALACLFLPFFWSSRQEIRVLVSWIGSAGAAVFLAASLMPGPLWVLLIGLTVYDLFAVRSGQLYSFLTDLSERRGVLTAFVSMTGLKTRFWASQLILPLALIAQATWQQPLHGVYLILALLIGTWYAIMRTGDEQPMQMMPWALVWMGVAELLIRWVHA